MSRPIKFMAWHKIERKLCDVKILTNDGAFLVGVMPGCDTTYNDRLTVMAPTDGRFCDNHEFELMQFTGLHDKNGTDIYEGDIIYWNRGYVDDSRLDLWPNKPYICKYIDGKFILHCCPMGVGGYILSFDGNKNGIMENCEVIGNIYRNPELTDAK